MYHFLLQIIYFSTHVLVLWIDILQTCFVFRAYAFKSSFLHHSSFVSFLLLSKGQTYRYFCLPFLKWFFEYLFYPIVSDKCYLDVPLVSSLCSFWLLDILFCCYALFMPLTYLYKMYRCFMSCIQIQMHKYDTEIHVVSTGGCRKSYFLVNVHLCKRCDNYSNARIHMHSCQNNDKLLPMDISFITRTF